MSEEKIIEEKIQDNVISRFMSNTISTQEIIFAMWVLYCVYGWKPDKVKRFKVNTLLYWLKKAKKRLTVSNALMIEAYFKPKEEKKSIWGKLKTKS